MDKAKLVQSGYQNFDDLIGPRCSARGRRVDSTGAIAMPDDLWQFTPTTGSCAGAAGSMTTANTIH
jgi:hypothetical protein